MSAVLPSPRDLPVIDEARLPATYETAKTALAQCVKLDECQEWANKAEALASYAKQAGDESLRKMADRIQARAIRRCGELLKQVEPATGGQPFQGNSTREGAHPSRKQAAEEAGLSEHQRKTALRVATIPEPEFDAAVEAADPPTITRLAEQGKKSRLVDLGSIPPADYARATEARATLRRFAEFCEHNEPTRIAGAYKPHEISALRRYVSTVDTWLDRFITHLPE
jgi:hypothetical protein